jgi:hypothetical protein
MKTSATNSISPGWARAKTNLAGAFILLILLLIFLLLRLWGTKADFTISQNQATFRQEFLTKVLNATTEELSRAKFPITRDTTVTLRPHHLCSGITKDRLCYALIVTTPYGPRSPSAKEHLIIAVDTASGEAVFVNNTEK